MSPASGEVQLHPVQIKFGDVVEFLHGNETSERYVIIDPVAEDYTFGSPIVSDRPGEEQLAFASTRVEPLRVLGSWPFETVVEATYRHHVGDGEEFPELKDTLRRLLQKNADKPPIGYTGKKSHEG